MITFKGCGYNFAYMASTIYMYEIAMKPEKKTAIPTWGQYFTFIYNEIAMIMSCMYGHVHYDKSQ